MKRLYQMSEIESAAASVIIRARVNDLTPVKITVIERTDKNLSRRDVRCNGNVVNIAHAEEVVFALGKSYFKTLCFGVCRRATHFLFLNLRNFSSVLLPFLKICVIILFGIASGGKYHPLFQPTEPCLFI